MAQSHSSMRDQRFSITIKPIAPPSSPTMHPHLPPLPQLALPHHLCCPPLSLLTITNINSTTTTPCHPQNDPHHPNTTTTVPWVPITSYAVGSPLQPQLAFLCSLTQAINRILCLLLVQVLSGSPHLSLVSKSRKPPAEFWNLTFRKR